MYREAHYGPWTVARLRLAGWRERVILALRLTAKCQGCLLLDARSMPGLYRRPWRPVDPLLRDSMSCHPRVHGRDRSRTYYLNETFSTDRDRTVGWAVAYWPCFTFFARAFGRRPGVIRLPQPGLAKLRLTTITELAGRLCLEAVARATGGGGRRGRVRRLHRPRIA